MKIFINNFVAQLKAKDLRYEICNCWHMSNKLWQDYHVK